MANLLWLHGGACNGNTQSFLNAEEPTVVDLVTDFGINILYHHSISMEFGEGARRILESILDDEIPLDILVFEGTVILGPNGTGRYDIFMGRPMKDWLWELAHKAQYVVAVGDCACWGGIPATYPNPTDSMGLQFLKDKRGGFLGPDFRSRAGLPVINIPGCPAHPDWVTQVLVAIATGRAQDVVLDELQRPQTFFKTFTQTGCTRVQYFDVEGTRRGIRAGHAQGLPLLRVRLPRSADPFTLQPDPLEPAVVQDPCGYAVPRLHRAPVPALRPGPGDGLQDPEGLRRRPARGPVGHRSLELHGSRGRRALRGPQVGPRGHVRALSREEPVQPDRATGARRRVSHGGGQVGRAPGDLRARPGSRRG